MMANNQKRKSLYWVTITLVSILLIQGGSLCLAQDVVWTVTENPSGSRDYPTSITADACYIYVAGSDRSPGNYQWRIQKRNKSDGSVVWTVTDNPSGSDGSDGEIIGAITCDDDYIYVGGWDYSLGHARWRIQKRNKSDGSVIWTVTDDPGPSGVYALAADDTYIYAAGHESYACRIQKRNKSDGSAVWTVTEKLSTDDSYNAITIDDSYIYVSGFDYSPGGNDQWRIQKRNKSDGSVVWTETDNPSSSYDEAQAITSDGTFIYVAGYDSSPGYQNYQWRIQKRDKSNGSAVWTVIDNPSSSNDAVHGITSDDSSIYVVGYSSSGDGQWRIQKRDKSDGSIVWTETENPSGSEDRAFCITSDGTYIYIAGYDSSQGDRQWRIQKRETQPPCEPTWQPMVSPTTAYLADVWGSASDDVFAVGYAGTILHYDGDGDDDGSPDNIWEVLFSPMTVTLFGVSGSGPNDVYVVGHGGTGTSTVLRYDGDTWESLPMPDVAYDIYLEDIWVSGSHAFAVGYRAVSTGQIIHWQNGNLSSHNVIDGPLGYTALFEVWGRGSDDVYASGYNGSPNPTGLMYHYDGTTWELFHPDGLGDHNLPKTRGIYGISGSDDSPDELFLAGESFGGPPDCFAEALYYDGTDWETEIFQESHVLKKVWGSSQEDVYMVGYNGMILHGGNEFVWSTMDSGTTEDLFGIWGNGCSDVFVVGRHGTILHQHCEQPCWQEQEKLLASDGVSDDYFGWPVCTTEDYAIVGACHDDNATGSAYVFKRNGESWIEQAKLTASDKGSGDFFGNSVYICSEYAIVGAYGDDSGKGSAYIFAPNDLHPDNWDQVAKLTRPDAVAHDSFGVSVHITGESAMVGAHYDDNKGSTYIFAPNDLDPKNWDQIAKLTASDAAADDQFGVSVSRSGDYAIVGAMFDDDMGFNSGSAYIFKRDGTNWTEVDKLTASDGAVEDVFGLSVCISGDYVIVGAHYDDDKGHNSGSAYVFKRDGETWIEQTKLTAPDGAAGDRFAHSVSMFDNYVIVGAPHNQGAGGVDSGAAYVFVRGGQEWSCLEKVIPSNGGEGDQFGVSVSITGHHALIGAIYGDGNQPDSGSAYVFENICNTEPNPANDVYSMDEDNTLTVDAPNGVLANDTDPEADPLLAELLSDVNNGSLTLNPDGSFIYTPNENFNGTDSFTYVANDGQLSSNLATVTITVKPINDAADFAILALNGGSLIINSATSIIGNVGYSRNVSSETNQKAKLFDGSALVHGQVQSFSYTAKNFAPAGGIDFGQDIDTKLDQANADAIAASAYYSSLAPTHNLGDLGDNDSVVVTSTGSLNIILLNSLNYKEDCIELVSREGSNDYFVVNVAGDFNFAASQIKLTGTTPTHLLFNFLGDSSRDIVIKKSESVFNGTILAPQANVEYHNPATFAGAIIGLNIDVHSDFNLTHEPFDYPSN